MDKIEELELEALRTIDKIKEFEKYGYPELANKTFEDLPEGNLKKLVFCLLVAGIA